MIIDTNIWNSLLVCIAHKTDVRSYLRGINIDVKNKRISSTDGHRLFVKNEMVFDNACVFPSIIVELDNTFKAPNTITHIEIDESKFELGEKVQVNYYKGDEVVLSRYANLNEQRFPDIDRVLPTEGDETKTSMVAVNPEYIADISKAIGSKSIRLNIHKGDKYSIDFIPYKDVQYVVMAMRT